MSSIVVRPPNRARSRVLRKRPVNLYQRAEELSTWHGRKVRQIARPRIVIRPTLERLFDRRGLQRRLTASSEIPEWLLSRQEAVRRVANRFSGSLKGTPDSVEDLVQEGNFHLLPLHERLKTLEDSEKGGMDKLITNTLFRFFINRTKYLQNRKAGSLDGIEDPDGLMEKSRKTKGVKTPADEAEVNDELNQAMRLMEGLPKKQREVLQRVALEGKSYEETARETGRTVDAVKDSLFRARQSMSRLKLLEQIGSQARRIKRTGKKSRSVKKNVP